MGGFVMVPLAAVAIVLWYALVFRLLNVRSDPANSRELLKQAQAGNLNSQTVAAQVARHAIAQAQSGINRLELKSRINEEIKTLKLVIGQHKKLVRSLVAVAPLLGLLGTVDGMIETFDSLSDMELFSQSGGIAGGISKALFTTQMGLAISIPGLLIGQMIERKERNICRKMDQIRDLACAKS